MRGPDILRHPTARHLVRKGLRIRLVHHIDPEHGLIHDSSIRSLEPLMPPAHFLVRPVEPERRGEIREDVTPRSDQTLARNFEIGEKLANDALVRIAPTVDYIDRALDGGIVRRNGAAFPVGIVALMRRPRLQYRRRRFQALPPQRLPLLA